jgi:hypothetical protein
VIWLAPGFLYRRIDQLTNRAALICGLVMLAQTTAAHAQAPVVLACKLPAAGAMAATAPAERFFRVAPGSFQEWDAARRKFGQNLCVAYACSKAADRTEGSISSASVTYTVGVIHATGEAYWRAAGASGLAADHGSCRIAAPPNHPRP